MTNLTRNPKKITVWACNVKNAAKILIFRNGLLYEPRSSNEMRHVENQFPELKSGKKYFVGYAARHAEFACVDRNPVEPRSISTCNPVPGPLWLDFYYPRRIRQGKLCVEAKHSEVKAGVQSTFCSSTEAELIVCQYNMFCGPLNQFEGESNDDKTSVENAIDENENLTNGIADKDDKDYDGNKNGKSDAVGSDDRKDNIVIENKNVLEKITDDVTNKTHGNDNKKDNFVNKVTENIEEADDSEDNNREEVIDQSGVFDENFGNEDNDVNEPEGVNVDAGNNYDADANAYNVDNDKIGQKDNTDNENSNNNDNYNNRTGDNNRDDENGNIVDKDKFGDMQDTVDHNGDEDFDNGGNNGGHEDIAEKDETKVSTENINNDDEAYEIRQEDSSKDYSERKEDNNDNDQDMSLFKCKCT